MSESEITSLQAQIDALTARVTKLTQDAELAEYLAAASITALRATLLVIAPQMRVVSDDDRALLRDAEVIVRRASAAMLLGEPVPEPKPS